MKSVNLLRWSRVLAIASALSIAFTLTASTDGGQNKEQEQVKKATPETKVASPKAEPSAPTAKSADDYVVVMTEKDDSPVKVYQKYLEKADLWRSLADYNLLSEGVKVRVPKEMLKSGILPAKVTKASGRVEIARNFDWKWIPVVPNLLVSEGDWIRTRARSSVEIRQDDGTVIQLRPDTKVMFTTSGQTSSARGEVRVTKLNLESGSLSAKVQKLLARDSRFEIKTPTATSFIRGTEFRVKVEDQGATRLEVLEGAIDFGSEQNHVSVAGNYGSRATAGTTPEAPHALPAAPAALMTPENRQVLEGDITAYRFSWAAVSGAARYHVEVAADQEFKQLVDESWVDSTGAELANFNLQTLEPGTYFWRVSAIDAQGYESPWSEARHFVYPAQLK